MPWGGGLRAYIQKKRNFRTGREVEVADVKENMLEQSLKNYLLISTQPVSSKVTQDSIWDTIKEIIVDWAFIYLFVKTTDRVCCLKSDLLFKSQFVEWWNKLKGALTFMSNILKNQTKLHVYRLKFQRGVLIVAFPLVVYFQKDTTLFAIWFWSSFFSCLLVLGAFSLQRCNSCWK